MSDNDRSPEAQGLPIDARTGRNDVPVFRIDAETVALELPWLRRLALDLVRDSNRADDLVQDTCAAVAAEAPKYVHSRRGFLRGVMRNVARAAWRQDRQRHERERIHRSDRGESVDMSAPDESVEQLEVLEVLLGEVRRLPGTQGRVLQMQFIEKLSTREIADALGIEESSVRASRSLGLARLREILDGRFGGRGPWTTALLPLGAPFLRPTEHASDLGEAVGAAGGRAKVTAGGVGTFGLLKVLVAGLPFLAALLWFAASTVGRPAGTTTLAAAPRPASDRGAEANDPEALHSTPVLARALAPSSPEGGPTGPGNSARPTAARPPAAGADASGARKSFAGKILASRDDAPLDDVDVRITYVHAGETRTATAKTDRDGRFETEPIPASVRVLRLRLTDGARAKEVIEFPGDDCEIRLPLDGPLHVHAGPRIEFALSGDGDLSDVRGVLETVRPGRTKQRARVRAGGVPWARFHEPIAEDATALVFLGADGFTFGTLALQGGARPHGPVRLRTEWRGGLLLQVDPERERDLGHARVRPVGGLASDGRSTRFQASVHAAAETGQKRGTAAFTHLAPGTYRYTAKEGAHTHEGTVTVTAGRWTVVRLAAPIERRSSLSVAIDATRVPGASAAEWRGWFKARDDASLSVEAVLVPNGPGRWAATATEVPEAEWTFRLTTDPGVRAVEREIDVSGPRPTLILEPGVRTQSVLLHVVDEGSGALLSHVEVTDANGRVETPARMLGLAEAFPIRLAATEPTALYVRAAGHRMRRVVYDPSVDGTALEVRLAAGWSNCVRVLESRDGAADAPVRGTTVTVDGTVVGTTDAEGELWLTADGPPRLLEIAPPTGFGAEGEGWRFVGGLSGGGRESVDPAEGYRFLLERL